MFRPILIAFSLACAVPASGATMANFSTSIDITLQSDPGEEIVVGGGYLPGPSSIITSGDFSLTTGDDGGGDACCMSGFVDASSALLLGNLGLSAEGAVNSAPGSVFAEGERIAELAIGNFGSSVEALTLTFDIAMAIAQLVDPLVGGAAASGTGLTIQRDGDTIYTQALESMTDDVAMGSSFMDAFTYNFVLNSTDSLSTVFRFSITGGVHASSDATALGYDVAPVPLPAGGLLLLSALVGGVCLRRRFA